MKILRGTTASDGVAIGRIKKVIIPDKTVKKHSITNVAAEVSRFKSAVEKAKYNLGILYEKTVENATEEEAEIFSIHIMMLEDGSFTDCCESIIFEQSVNAEYAISEAAKIVSAMLVETNDEYMMARTTDVEDIKNGVLSALLDEIGEIEIPEDTILFAFDLTPSYTVRLDKSKILGFVTEKGSRNSHSAILARAMGIPSLVGVAGCMKEVKEGEICAIDTGESAVFIAPDEKITNNLLAKKAEEGKRKEYLKELRGKESVTKSGKRIKLYANIGNEDDLEDVLNNDAEGIGLLRSEFLYIGKNQPPDEETQYAVYKKVLSKMGNKETVIRTLDIGADKQAEYLGIDREENPALGYRAIRICINEKELFKTQLRALYRASVFGNLLIMFPMITSKQELTEAIDIVNEVKEELRAQKNVFREDVKLGIMIETPAAALISDELAQMVDFFSIGTNDLVQYTLAADRQNDKVANVYNPLHPAVLKLIKITCDNAHNAGIWVGICGEMASDTSLTELLLSLGADELSVSPVYVLPVRESIVKGNWKGKF